ncbi:MAG: hypothetical protein FJ096_14260 [Deltaproteobacteria bacterium]|nr:hypothetical protein [Deltaproteobacteria bacterium]
MKYFVLTLVTGLLAVGCGAAEPRSDATAPTLDGAASSAGDTPDHAQPPAGGGPSATTRSDPRRAADQVGSAAREAEPARGAAGDEIEVPPAP